MHEKLTLISYFYYTLNTETAFCFFTDGKQHESREVDMITLRNHGQSCTVVIHDDMITGHGANDYQ